MHRRVARSYKRLVSIITCQSIEPIGSINEPRGSERREIKLIKRMSLVLVVCATVFLISGAMAYGPITYDFNGNLIVKYVSQSTDANDAFGISSPVTKTLGNVHGSSQSVAGTEYTEVGRCSPGTDIVLFFQTPEKNTYSSDKIGSDGIDHVFVQKQDDGSYNVAFENSVGTSALSESEYNDVVLNVECVADPTPVPEFPTLALPIGMIIGVLGGILFIRETRES